MAGRALASAFYRITPAPDADHSIAQLTLRRHRAGEARHRAPCRGAAPWCGGQPLPPVRRGPRAGLQAAAGGRRRQAAGVPRHHILEHPMKRSRRTSLRAAVGKPSMASGPEPRTAAAAMMIRVPGRRAGAAGFRAVRNCRSRKGRGPTPHCLPTAAYPQAFGDRKYFLGASWCISV